MQNSKNIFLHIFAICFIAVLCITKNPGWYHVFLANFNIFTHNTNAAIVNYEQAMDYIELSENDRDTFVDLVMKTPINSNAQKYLLKIVKSEQKDNARALAVSKLNELRDEIAENYPNNYIRQATFNQKIIRWNKFPITYGFINPQSAPEYYTEEIENAFALWQNITENKISFKRDDNKPNIIIKFAFTNNSSNDYENGQKYVVAYTQPSFKFDKLENMTINFGITAPNGEEYSPNFVYNTAIHEIIHALGFMGHSDNPRDIMYLSSSPKVKFDDLRTKPTIEDLYTLELLYDIEPDITNGNPTPTKYIPYLIIGNENDVANAKIREAQIYISKAPNLPIGYIDLAISYMSVNEYNKAIKNLHKALTLSYSDKTSAIIYNNLAIAYFVTKDYRRAEIYANKVLDIHNSDEIEYLLANIYEKKGDLTKAERQYKLLCAKYPEKIEYAISLTNMFVKKHMYLSARKVLKNYIKHNPSAKNNSLFRSYGILSLGL
ncbi:MAG: matrixin family metalloprotease [bacterium]|nr:matrixin family metalloprotease [bacterium]